MFFFTLFFTSRINENAGEVSTKEENDFLSYAHFMFTHGFSTAKKPKTHICSNVNRINGPVLLTITINIYFWNGLQLKETDEFFQVLSKPIKPNYVFMIFKESVDIFLSVT